MKRSSSVKRVISKDKEKEFSKVRPASNSVSSKKAVDEKMLFEASPLLSRKIVPNSLEPKKVTFLEENEECVAEKAILSSSIVSAPNTLTHEQVKLLLDIPLEYSTIKLNFGVEISGQMASRKSDIQGGLAYHKLPAAGVTRIANILEEYPKSYAMLDIDEKRPVHTLSADGYQGVLGHYNLILSQEEGGYKVLPKSKFTIAFATK